MNFSQTKEQINSLFQCSQLDNDKEGYLEKIYNNLNILANN